MDARPLKTSLLPVTQRTLEDIKQCINFLARNRCLACLDDINIRVEVLEQRPQDLDQYMRFKVTHQEQVEAKKEVLKSAQAVDDMYEVLAASG